MNNDDGITIAIMIMVFAALMVSAISAQTKRICKAIESIEVHNTSNIRTPSVTILDGDWNVREEKGE